MRKGRCDINKKTWFTTKSEGLGIAFQPESNVPYAVVMDIGLGAGTVTIFSSNLGDGVCIQVVAEESWEESREGSKTKMHERLRSIL